MSDQIKQPGMTNAEYLKALRAVAKAEGRCYVCRARPAKSGCSSCQHCLDLGRQHEVMLKASGRCPCGKPPRPGLATCARCIERNKISSKKRIAELYALGVCIRCLGDNTSGGRNCASCKIEMAAYQRARRRAKTPRFHRPHLCGSCGVTGHNVRTCDSGATKAA